LGIVYHFLYWLPCIRPFMVDHSPLLKKMVAEHWIKLRYLEDGLQVKKILAVSEDEISQSGAWRIITAFWHARKDSNYIKGANERVASLGNTMHGLGTACVGSLLAIPAWALLHFRACATSYDYYGIIPFRICQFDWCISDFSCYRVLLLLIIFFIIFIVHWLNFKEIIKDFTSVINLVTIDQIRYEYAEKNKNNPIEIIVTQKDLQEKYPCFTRIYAAEGLANKWRCFKDCFRCCIRKSSGK